MSRVHPGTSAADSQLLEPQRDRSHFENKKVTSANTATLNHTDTGIADIPICAPCH